MTSRQRVYDTLNFCLQGRAPRDMWVLPWAQTHFPGELRAIVEDFPVDITGAPGALRELPPTKGDIYSPGQYIDEWGCAFENIQPGIVGEVKHPLSTAEDWSDIDRVRIPVEQLSVDIDEVNAFCARTEQFVLSGACPRPFEQLQFIRGSEQFFVDLMERPPRMMAFIERMHAFYCDQLSIWAKTGVDALRFMDDWGAQQSLLISPALWAEIFGPMYKDYIDIAHGAGKKVFMHSDGYTLDIFPHLVALGLDAINAQVFCIGPEKLQPFAGKITFWGEMDRQHLLPYGTPEDIRQAAWDMKKNLYRDGGVIAQLEFGIGARPENVRAFYEAWEEMG